MSSRSSSSPTLSRCAAASIAVGVPLLVATLAWLGAAASARAACTNGDPLDCNPAGATLNPAARFVDPSPPVGWAQCAGFINTAADDVAFNWENNCIPFNNDELFMRIYDMSDTIIAGARLFSPVACPWLASVGYDTDQIEGAGFLGHSGVCDGSNGTTFPWSVADESFCTCTSPAGGTRTCNDIFTASASNTEVFYVGANSTSHPYEAVWGPPGGKNSCSLDLATEIHELKVAIYAPDPDADMDGIPASTDNCPNDANPMQEDADMDGVGDVCDACPADPDNDIDLDMICGDVDNCPNDGNVDQLDADMDAVGDACDACPNDPDNDVDGDEICGDVDSCPLDPNPLQTDDDGDGLGNICDPCDDDPGNDEDMDMVCFAEDNCPDVANPDQVDSDGNGMGDACDPIAGTTGTGGADETGDSGGASGGSGDASTGGDETGPAPGTTSGFVTGLTGLEQPNVDTCACSQRGHDGRAPWWGLGLLGLLGLRRRGRRRRDAA